MHDNLVKLVCNDCGFENTFKVKPNEPRPVGDRMESRIWFENECQKCTADFYFDLFISIKPNGNINETDNTTGAELVQHSITFKIPA